MEEPGKKRIEAQTVVFIRHRGSHDEIGKVYHELYEWVRGHKLKVAGQGFTVFLKAPGEFNTEFASFEVCLPAASAPMPGGRVGVKELPACTVAHVTVKGPYSEVPARYTELLAWLSAEGTEVVGPPREVYITHPDTRGQGDANELVTEIQFPIAE